MADSPFEATARRLGAFVGALQALFFCCVARALLANRADEVKDALPAAQEFAMTGRVPDEIAAQMLAGLDAHQARLDEVDPWRTTR